MGSPTATIKITNIAPDRFARLEVTVTGKGLEMKGNSGEVKKFGADVDYDYMPETQTLMFLVKHGPHLENFDKFCAELESWVVAQA
jgi:hypothetical protein